MQGGRTQEIGHFNLSSDAAGHINDAAALCIVTLYVVTSQIVHLCSYDISDWEWPQE